MDPRLRAGLISGSGAAVAVFLTSFVCFCLSGPFIAAIAGASAGFAIVRDVRYARKPGEAGAIAGLYGGTVVALAQLIGMTLTVALERDQLLSQMTSWGYTYSAGTLWGVTIFWSIVMALVDAGIMAGAGAVAAINAAKRMYGSNAQSFAARGPVPPYPMPYPPAPQPPPVAPAVTQPPPPTSYPPPPSYYGLPDVTATDPPNAPPDTPEV
jgi:hypothetical protein